MPKPEWGVKRSCLSCGTRFYDLSRDPILCPSCGAEFDLGALTKTRRTKVAAATAASAAKKTDAAEKKEDALIEEDEVLDDEADVNGEDADDLDDDMDDVDGDVDDADSDDEAETFTDEVLLEEDEEDNGLAEIGDVAAGDPEET